MAAAAPISPELVLVCPDLAERARAALPDRPWEVFLPRLPLRPAASHPEPVPVAVAGTAAPPAPTAGSAPIAHSWPGRLVSIFPAVLIAGFVAVVVAGSLPWLGQRPTLGPEPPHVQPLPAVTPSARTSPTPGATTQAGLRGGLSGPVSPGR